jgi:hypothetical protein
LIQFILVITVITVIMALMAINARMANTLFPDVRGIFNVGGMSPATFMGTGSAVHGGCRWYGWCGCGCGWCRLTSAARFCIHRTILWCHGEKLRAGEWNTGEK